jgi:hypothetical protein
MAREAAASIYAGPVYSLSTTLSKDDLEGESTFLMVYLMLLEGLCTTIS